MWQVAQTHTWQCDSRMMWQVEQAYNVTVWQWNDVTDNTDLPCDSVTVEWCGRWHRLTRDSVTVEWCGRWHRLSRDSVTVEWRDRWHKLTMWQCDSGMMCQVAQTYTWQCDSRMMWQVAQTYYVTVWQWNDVTDGTNLQCDSVTAEWRDRWHRLSRDRRDSPMTAPVPSTALIIHTF